MRRYFLEPGSIQDSEVLITGDDFHHIYHVCRHQVGDRFEVLGVEHKAFLVELLEVSKKTAKARILETRSVPPLPLPRIYLAVSLSRFATMDTIVEKAVELGVAEFRPFVSTRSFMTRVEKIPASKVARWDKIVKGATQQSGRGEKMPVMPVVPLPKLLEEFNQRHRCGGLFAYEGLSDTSIKPALRQLSQSDLSEIWIFVGSEGGFSEDEVSLFAENGLRPVTVGDQVLRVETACLALVSVIKYEFDLMS